MVNNSGKLNKKDLIQMKKDWSTIPFDKFIIKWKFDHGLVNRTFNEMNKMLREAGLDEK